MINDYNRLALDTLAAIAGYSVSVMPPPAPVVSPLKIYVQAGEPEGKSGLWVDDTAATGSTYVLPVLTAADRGEREWTAEGTLPAARGNHASQTVAGDVYVFGGNSPSSMTASCIKRNAATGAWTSIANMPATRTRHAAVTDGTDCYILHGMNTSQKMWYKYTVSTNTWSELKSWTTTPTYDYGAAYCDGKIYVTGGNATTSVFYRYNISTNTFSSLGSLPAPRCEHACEAIGGSLYIALGSSGSAYLSDCRRYDIAAGVWSSAASNAYPLRYCRSVSVDGKMYAVGNTVGGNTSNVNIYTPSTDTWSDGPHTGSDTKTGFSYGVLSDRVLLIGGYLRSESSYTDAVMSLKKSVPPSRFSSGDVVVVCTPATSRFSIAEGCELPLSAVYVVANGAFRTAQCRVGDGESWTRFGT